jgi:hypothetical protein
MCRGKNRASSRHLGHWVEDVTEQVTGGGHRARQQSNWQNTEHKIGTQGGNDNVHNTLRAVLSGLYQQRQKAKIWEQNTFVRQIYYTVTTSRKLKQHTVVICDCDVHCKDKYMPCAGENQESFFCMITGNITLHYHLNCSVV